MRLLSIYIVLCALVLTGFSFAKFQGLALLAASGAAVSSGPGGSGRYYGGSSSGSSFHK